MVKVFNLDGTEKGDVKLPKVFSKEYRPDLIKKAVLSIQSGKRQPYGPNLLAGKRTSARYIGTQGRHGMKNKELARVPRVVGSSGQQERRARFAPQTTSGRKAHPPKVEKVWEKKINKKEMKVALLSAISATANLELVKAKHRIEKEVPIVVDDRIEKIGKTSELKKILLVLGFKKEADRAKKKKIRAGKGKMRGRKYKRKKSFLFVVSKNNGIVKACKNIPGVDICNAKNLNVELLAPGCMAGRLVIFSEDAVKKLGEIYG